MSERLCQRDPFRRAAEESRELSEEEACHIAHCPCCQKLLEGEAIAISSSLRRCLCHDTAAPATLRTRIVQSLEVYMQTDGMQVSYRQERFSEDL
ncbi:hypothetical protein [Varibaculum vaginae]|uniref:hypothetical protein n=1 Tax=Varibaculum vaginae TaxID=2364797 RepID=UPI000F09A15E|nr:hypothetical protein [Varibaculum vaginae]